MKVGRGASACFFPADSTVASLQQRPKKSDSLGPGAMGEGVLGSRCGSRWRERVSHGLGGEVGPLPTLSQASAGS